MINSSINFLITLLIKPIIIISLRFTELHADKDLVVQKSKSGVRHVSMSLSQLEKKTRARVLVLRPNITRHVSLFGSLNDTSRQRFVFVS